jgi:hypothetical protein
MQPTENRFKASDLKGHGFRVCGKTPFPAFCFEGARLQPLSQTFMPVIALIYLRGLLA